MFTRPAGNPTASRSLLATLPIRGADFGAHDKTESAEFIGFFFASFLQ
jgi:hypothetical protein